MSTELNVNVQPELTPTLEQRLLPLVEQRQTLSAEIKTLEGKQRDLTDQISSELLAEGHDKAKIGDWSLTFTARERRTIDKDTLRIALLERGVAMDVIDGAVRVAEKVSGYTQLDVRKTTKR